ncbi:hypothetical protein MIH18_23815 (plasmid) [Marinobacter sp. M3C]|jgi:hypothetical protein|uniref:hypothetical protein n=1 Tax=Marinobacter sp. M3C TaxID=2917715 RepID=UPI00200EB4A4|nr:hypothetical protein [Marinobacter sp. M3C]MCL1485187.1 hypothetical protein [Marinobacter sp.]UQG62789.1 hypothetical protein MIH18_23815 [Marinobacter sp. M3C]
MPIGMVNRSGSAPDYRYNNPLPKRPIAPNSVTISWFTSDTQRTLTDDGEGNLAGDGSGTVSYATGLIFISPDPSPSPTDGDYSISYTDWRGTEKLTEQVVINEGGDTSFTPMEAMKEGSITIDVTLKRITTKYTYNEVFGKTSTFNYETVNATLTDDGAGGLQRSWQGQLLGTVNYATGEINFDARISYNHRNINKNQYSRWESSTVSGTETYVSGEPATIRWTSPADGGEIQTITRPIPPMTIDLTPTSERAIIANSVVFDFAGKRYFDRNGSIIKDWSPTTNAGTAVGSIDYTTGLVTLQEYPAYSWRSDAVALIACATTLNEAPASQTIFRTAGSPLREGSLIVNATDLEGNNITLTADTAGNLSGANIAEGFVDTQTGLVNVQWSNVATSQIDINPSTVRYSAVSYSFLPLDADLVGLDATRLPSDGRVPQFNLGDVVVISNTQQQEIITATPGQVIDFARVNQAEVWIEGANGNRLAAYQYTLDTDAGTLTFADPLALIDAEANAVTEPLQVFNRVEDMGLATDVQIGGQISLNIPLSQDYTAGDTIASAALLYGDLRARAHNAFHQKSWSGAWADDRAGDDTTAKYNLVSSPIEITNQGAIKERWAIRFTSSTSFEVIGETVGVVAAGNIATDLAPTNEATGAPYFTIRSNGWSSGWVSGNTLRFNTDGGQAPFWVARTIVAGRATEEEDQFATQNRGDAD